jgi:hypothetical protein
MLQGKPRSLSVLVFPCCTITMIAPTVAQTTEMKALDRDNDGTISPPRSTLPVRPARR